MESYTVDQIVQALNGRLLADDDTEEIGNRHVGGVSTDSRTIEHGQVFFAIVGKRFDGHDFVKEAVERAGIPAVVSRPLEGVPVILVGDTVLALGDLAKSYRRRLGSRTVAVTGTNGKTTTKEMSAAVLSMDYVVHRNKGNMNNLIGLPLSVLEMASDDEVGVFEMGMSESGEIARLCQISEPSLGVITNVGPCHLQSLGSIEDVAKAKGELLDYLDEGKQAVLNLDDPLLRKMAGETRAEVTGFAIDHDAQIRAQDLRENGWGTSFSLVSGGDFTIPVPGLFNVYNALAAIGVGLAFGVESQKASLALSGFIPEKQRMAVVKLNGVTIIDDSYNANPASVMCALQVICTTPASRRVVVLGDMLELGARSSFHHRRIGEEMKGHGVAALFTYGTETRHTADSARESGMREVMEFSDKSQLISTLKLFLKDGDLVLVKGSRGMGMEEVVQALLQGAGSEMMSNPSEG